MVVTSRNCGTFGAVETQAELTGQVWFDFASSDVWLFYRFIRAAAGSGIPVALDWQPLPTVGQDLAMSVFAAIEDPLSRGKFLHAMLGLVHLEGMPADEPTTVSAAIASAGVDSEAKVVPELLAEREARATALSIGGTPTLYRDGSPIRVVLTGAALMGDFDKTSRTIVAAMENDGIWELRKP